MRTYTFWIIVLILVLTFIWLMTLPRTSEAPVGCTMEARICPDGSTVGRTGPNCEFAPCVGVTSNTPPVVDGGLEGITPEANTPPLDGNFLPPPEYERPYDGNIACTMDAKMCPDGTYVGRVPPHCNFAECLGEEGSSEGTPQDTREMSIPNDDTETLILSQ